MGRRPGIPANREHVARVAGGRNQPDRAHAEEKYRHRIRSRRQDRGGIRQASPRFRVSNRTTRPARKPAIFDAPWGRTAVLISQDLDFPATARELAAHDVRIVLAPASDWTGSELIHQQMAVVRGVEFGFSLARAARGGILSASCSRGKEIAARSPIHTEDTTLTADIPLGTGSTLYSRTGRLVRSSLPDFRDLSSTAAGRDALVRRTNAAARRGQAHKAGRRRVGRFGQAG